jgi:hypothetical protein
MAANEKILEAAMDISMVACKSFFAIWGTFVTDGTWRQRRHALYAGERTHGIILSSSVTWQGAMCDHGGGHCHTCLRDDGALAPMKVDDLTHMLVTI